MKWCGKKLRQIREKKQGFTLVELIVVLVILALLAAIMIPSMIGWINKAQEKQDTLAMNTVVKAAKSAYVEVYGETAPSSTDIEILANEFAQPDSSNQFANHMRTYLNDSDFYWFDSKSGKYRLSLDITGDKWSIYIVNINTKNVSGYFEQNGVSTVFEGLENRPDGFEMPR